MFVKRYGHGPRQFLGLHGWSGDHRSFAPLVAHQPEDATLVCPDLPGCGRSPLAGRLTLDSLADEIAAGMIALDGTFTLVGNCSGALFGLAAIERHPEMVEKIERFVMIDPFAYTPWYFRLLVTPVFGRLAYYSSFGNPIGRWLTNLSLAGHRTEESDLTESFSEVDLAVSYRYLEIMTSIESIDRWKGIMLPTDLLYGARTFGAIRKSVSMWRQIWPHLRLHELSAAGHLPVEEATADLSCILYG